jgi:hypothetical protein
MYCCLCTSIILICVFAILGVLYEIGSVFDENGNEIMTPNQLRGNFIEAVVNDRYNKIYRGVLDSSIKGQTSFSFTIMCIRPPNTRNCDNYDGYQEWFQNYFGGTIPNIHSKQKQIIKKQVIEKIQNAFPGSNITKGYENCCDVYRITW